MLTGPLPALIAHRNMANQENILEGSVPVMQLERLSDLLTGNDGDVHLRLAFSKGSTGRTHVSGTVMTTVGLICQNCLTPHNQILECVVDLEIVRDAVELAELDEDSDGFICTERNVRVVDLIEDDLILAVPMIPRHDDGDCPDSEYQQEGEAPPVEPETTHRPFADLASVIDKQKD